MKKIISLILIASMLLFATGCNGEKSINNDTQPSALVDITEEVSSDIPKAEETTGIPETETIPEETTGIVETEPVEETTEVTEALEETTLPEEDSETAVVDTAEEEWIVESSTLFGSYNIETEEETTAVETEPEAPETEAPVEDEPVLEEEEEEEEEELYEPEEIEPYDPSKPTTYPTVLMYHCVCDEPYTENVGLFVKPSELEKQIQLLLELDIDCLFSSEFGPVNKNSVILTFDDGYEDNYTYMFPIIKKYNVKVTVFVIAYMIDKPGYLTSEQIKEMSDSGLVEFGSHTLDHPSLTGLSEDAIREQFAGASWIISQKTGKDVTTVAYPSGDYNETVMRIAREYYRFAYTTDATAYYGQDYMMLPRYAVYRDHTIHTFRSFIER